MRNVVLPGGIHIPTKQYKYNFLIYSSWSLDKHDGCDIFKKRYKWLKKHILVIIIPFPSPMCPFLTPLVYATLYPLDKERSRRVFSPNPVKGVARGRGSRGAHDPLFWAFYVTSSKTRRGIRHESLVITLWLTKCDPLFKKCCSSIIM